MTGTACSIDGNLLGREVATNRIYMKGRPFNMVGTPVAQSGGSNQTFITIQLTDFDGNNIVGVYNFDVWLSDAVSGAGLTATTASGAVANSGTGGADLAVYTAKKALYVQTDATGKYVLAITDTAKTAFKVFAINPSDGQATLVSTLLTANYG